MVFLRSRSSNDPALDPVRGELIVCKGYFRKLPLLVIPVIRIPKQPLRFSSFLIRKSESALKLLIVPANVLKSVLDLNKKKGY